MDALPRRPRRALPIALSLALGLALAAGVATRPLTAPLPETVQMGDMTWVEVRAAIQAGATTAIVPSGGIEANGVHMTLAKHDHIVRHAAEAIARDLRRTLVTPVISFVPQGGFDPPSGNLVFPGTLGVTAEAYAATLEGVARSLKAAGFRTILFIADHGASQAPQAEVAERLDRAWRAEGVRVLHVHAYYDDAPAIAWLRAAGESREAIGNHAGIQDTSELMAVRPDAVDLSRLGGLPRLEPTGASGDAARASPERGRALLSLRIEAALRQVRAAFPTH